MKEGVCLLLFATFFLKREGKSNEMLDSIIVKSDTMKNKFSSPDTS